MDPNRPQPTPQNNNGPGFTTGPNGAPGPGPQPGVYNSPSLTPTPYGSQSSLQPQAVSGANSQLPAKQGPNKLVIIVIAGIALLVVLGIVAAVSTAGNKPKTNQTQQTEGTGQSENLKPAQAIDLQQASNAISQDLSSIDDEKNFPADSLEDKTLGL